MSIAVLGAGAFGTALAIALSQGGAPVVLWARDAEAAAHMQADRYNAARLPGAGFPDALRATHHWQDVDAAQIVLIAVPMQRLNAFMTEHAERLNGKTLVACCKGIDLSSGQGPVRLMHTACPDSICAILTGPSFAHDIALGLPTALTLACAEAGADLQEALSTQTLRLYRSADVTGAELGGALKNVMAIACGAAIGAGLGDSARAALITRGYAEMQRMALALGARADTLAGLSGFGDLVLTCTSDGSRNYRFGLSLGRKESFDRAVTVEGAATAQATWIKAQEMQIDMPITQAVTALIAGDITLDDALTGLLARPLKEETC